MVILPMVMQYSRMLQRNLLYTAVTRAKTTLILLGERRAFEESVRRQSVNRQTALVERLTATMTTPAEMVVTPVEDSASAEQVSQQTEPVVPQPTQEAEPSRSKPESVQSTSADDGQPAPVPDGVLTLALINSGQIDPMIGMKGITPKSFMGATELN